MMRPKEHSLGPVDGKMAHNFIPDGGDDQKDCDEQRNSDDESRSNDRGSRSLPWS
jgi:hypothetical protein